MLGSLLWRVVGGELVVQQRKQVIVTEFLLSLERLNDPPELIGCGDLYFLHEQ